MHKTLVVLTGLFFLLLWTGAASATLVKIGTAQFEPTGPEYNLIWDDDNNGNSVVWLDYTEDVRESWQAKKDWADSLNEEGTLIYNIDATYKVNLESNTWRLPATVDSPAVFGYDGTTTAGYNITSSEMGHLYHIEIGQQIYDHNGNQINETGFFPDTSEHFDKIYGAVYYYSTEAPLANPYGELVWAFQMQSGYQGHQYKDDTGAFAIAIQTAKVTVVPEPGTLVLLGSGLLGIAGVSRRRNKSAPHDA